MAAKGKNSWIPGDSPALSNGKGLTISVLISILTIAGTAVGGAIWVVRSDSATEDRVYLRCREALTEHRNRESEIYARASSVARLEAKIDGIQGNVARMQSDLREFRVETRTALTKSGRRGR